MLPRDRTTRCIPTGEPTPTSPAQGSIKGATQEQGVHFVSANRPGRINDTIMLSSSIGTRSLYLILVAATTTGAVRFPQAGSPELRFSDEGDDILANTPIEGLQPGRSGGTAGRATDLDAVAAALNANEEARQQAATPDDPTPSSSTDSTDRTNDLASASSMDSTSTTDDLFQAVSLPYGPDRDAIFLRIGANLDARHRRIFTPPGAGVWYAGPPKQTTSAGTQTYISLPGAMPHRKEKAVLAALHAEHRREGEHRSGAPYETRNSALHSRDQDTSQGAMRTGPISNPPWAPFMREIRAQTQTPRDWMHTIAPAAQGYVQAPPIRGLHYPDSGNTWITINPPVYPYIPDTDDNHGVRAGSAPHATLLPLLPREQNGHALPDTHDVPEARGLRARQHGPGPATVATKRRTKRDTQPNLGSDRQRTRQTSFRLNFLRALHYGRRHHATGTATGEAFAVATQPRSSVPGDHGSFRQGHGRNEVQVQPSTGGFAAIAGYRPREQQVASPHDQEHQDKGGRVLQLISKNG